MTPEEIYNQKRLYSALQYLPRAEFEHWYRLSDHQLNWLSDHWGSDRFPKVFEHKLRRIRCTSQR
jgi:hypothetical protein